jgi:predicted transcriptional regulator
MRKPKLNGLEKKAYAILEKEKGLTVWMLVEDLKINTKKANEIITSLLKKGIIKELEEKNVNYTQKRKKTP